MVIFHSYVSLPEGRYIVIYRYIHWIFIPFRNGCARCAPKSMVLVKQAIVYPSKFRSRLGIV